MLVDLIDYGVRVGAWVKEVYEPGTAAYSGVGPSRKSGQLMNCTNTCAEGCACGTSTWFGINVRYRTAVEEMSKIHESQMYSKQHLMYIVGQPRCNSGFVMTTMKFRTCITEDRLQACLVDRKGIENLGGLRNDGR